MTRRQVFAAAGVVAYPVFGAESRAGGSPRVRLQRLPDGGIQPQVIGGSKGRLHVLSYGGDARGGDIFYAHSTDSGKTFSSPIRVNSAGSAIAAGTIRGAQMALGAGDRVHVAWNGSSRASIRGPVNPDSGKPGEPMLYSRLNDAGTAFEPERNLMHRSFGLDGGGSVAADGAGNVFVVWHGISTGLKSGSGPEGEARRQVWLTKSVDGGRTFAAERPAWQESTGACACCGMKAFAGRDGAIHVLYRSAAEGIHRDVYLLTSTDGGKSFRGGLLHKWEVNACPMSSMDLAEGGGVVVGAWETGGQVYQARITSGRPETSQAVAAPGEGKGRKHPRTAVNNKGEVLLVWTEGTGWQRGGSLAWQVYDRTGQPTSERGAAPGVPTWSFAAPAANADGSFSILY